MAAGRRRLPACALLAGAVAVAGLACDRPGASPERSRTHRDAAPGKDPPAWLRGACGDEGWCWAYPRPLGVRLNRLWGSNARDLWAVGDAGTIVHFDGTGWSALRSGTQDKLVAISGRAPGDAWAVGRDRTILRLQGTTWRRFLPAADGGPPAARVPEEGTFADVTALPDGEAWLIGGLKKSSVVGEEIGSSCIVGHYDGAAWLFDHDDDDCGVLGVVWGSRPDDVWALGGDVVHWNGRYLVKNPAEKPPPIVGRHGYAAGWRLEKPPLQDAGGALVHPKYSPPGTSGASAAPAPSSRDFWAFGAEDVWSIASDGGLERFDGHTWTKGDPRIWLSAVSARAPDDVWAAGSPATLLHFDGRTWTSSPIRGPEAYRPLAIAVLAANDIWVLTEQRILRFDGKSWTELPTGLKGVRLYSLLARAPNDVWIGGEQRVLHWNGKALEAHAIDFVATSLWGATGDVWAGADIHRWDGSKFIVPPELGAGTDAGAGAGTKLRYDAGASADGAVWLVRGGRIARLQSGRLETIKELPVSLRSIWASPSGDIWAVGSHIVHGRGATWTIEQPLGLGELSAVGGAGGLVWVRGAQGILFRTAR